MKELINIFESAGFILNPESSQGKKILNHPSGAKIEICISCGNSIKFYNKENEIVMAGRLTNPLFKPFPSAFKG